MDGMTLLLRFWRKPDWDFLQRLGVCRGFSNTRVPNKAIAFGIGLYTT